MNGLSQRPIVICGATRTAVGRLGGSLQHELPGSLAALVIKESLRRADVPPERVQSVFLGQTRQSTAESNIARVAALRAGLAETATAATVHRQCVSSLQAIISGSHEILLGDAEVVIAGGTEVLSQSPYYLRGVRWGLRMGNAEIVDALTEAGPGAQPREIYGDLPMGLTAEIVAEQFGITRPEQDEFALQSQNRSLRAIADGAFSDQIVPVMVRDHKAEREFAIDEHPRETSLEQLERLPPAFKPGGTVTAGNTCGFNDGAAAAVLMPEDLALELGVRPQARIVAYAVCAVSPRLMGIGPVPAMRLALDRAGLDIGQLDIVELNEAFASQALACINELRLDRDLTNPNGGAIGLGHPIGATGSILCCKLVHDLARKGARYGAVAMCAGGGQGAALIVERV